MSWKDDFKKSFDRIYEIVRRKYPDIRFPCYGGRFYWFLITRHFESLYFYLTENSLIYTASSAYITEIPFDMIKNLSIKRGLFVRSSIHIRIVADKKYHLLLKDMKWLSARKTGNNEDNIQGFIQMLLTSVKNNIRGTKEVKEKRAFWKSKWLKIALIVCLSLAIVGGASILGVNAYVKSVGGNNIITPEEALNLEDVDCIIVLGCLVKDNGNPSDMLADRLKRGIELYEQGSAPKIIMSGDHGRENYDEVNTMKQVAIDAGVPSSDIFMDHAGFSTYESIYRAKDVFEADKIIIVTQEYHLYRALYIAEKLGIEAYGVNADFHTYWGQSSRELREILARCKDFANTIIKPEPTYLGETIPVSGDGDITNDK